MRHCLVCLSIKCLLLSWCLSCHMWQHWELCSHEIYHNFNNIVRQVCNSVCFPNKYITVHSFSSILSELGGTEERSPNTTVDFSAPGRVGVIKKQPEWLVRELLKQNRRRHSITLGDKNQITRLQQHHSIDSAHSLQVLFPKTSIQLWHQRIMNTFIISVIIWP